jgi:hypothetical protein
MAMLKTLYLKLSHYYFTYVYIQFMTMISYHGSYIAYTCDYKITFALCCIY